MQFVSEYIAKNLAGGSDLREISAKLSVGFTTVYNYREGLSNPSLAVAKRIYKLDKIAIHPFGEDNLKWELENDKK